VGAEHQASHSADRGERFDREQTRALFEHYAATRDTAIREQLVLAHLNLVRYLASRFANRGEPLDDLIQVGTLGLIKAIDRFDPTRGIEFTTYVTPTVIGEIKRHFRDKGWAIRVPRRLQELNVAVNRALDTLSAQLARSPSVSDLATALGATEEEIIEAQELGQAYAPLSLDVEVAGDSDRKNATLMDYLGREDPDMRLLEDKDLLGRAFGVLDPRERVIVYLRYYEHASQSEIAVRLRVSQMHVSRLQQRALAKMKGLLQEESSPDHAN
jgi:RNA polymerase sigma-B factor